jgi:hypothetical protein
MQTITSRTSNERIIRAAIFMLLVDVFTVLYLWDGYIGYPQQNRAELARVLGVSVGNIGPTLPSLTAERANSILERGTPQELAAVGEPSIVHENNKYFVGPGGWLRLNANNAAEAQWVGGPRTESDQRWQRYIGWALAGVGLLATLFFARVFATRATLSDQGLQLTGKPLVRWEEIRNLRADPHKRGVVELEYESNGSRRTLRMDDYLYKDLARITGEIAAKKSLNDPLAALQKT